MKEPAPPSLSPEMPALARQLADAWRDARQIEALPAQYVPPSASVAYDVNREVARLLGWEPLGWKIAGTTAAVRNRLGIDTPIYGRTFRRFVASSPATLELSGLLDPLVECECFVTLESALPWRPEAWTLEEVRAAIGSVHAGIEVAQCRFPSANLPAFPAILADGAASGLYVYGDELIGWRDGLAGIEVEVELDGQLRRTGSGVEVMGDPLAPLLWLAETLRARGLGIAAGEMISTGSMTGMLPVPKPCRVEARFGASAAVRIEFRQ